MVAKSVMNWNWRCGMGSMSLNCHLILLLSLIFSKGFSCLDSDEEEVNNVEMTSEGHVIKHPTQQHTVTVILLHAIGGVGATWKKWLPALHQPYMKIICPTAPLRTLSFRKPMKARAWFDFFGDYTEEDTLGLERSTDYIHSIIKKEIKNGIAPHNIFLGGFAQGGALAIYAGLNFAQQLGGLIAISAYMPTKEVMPINKENKNTPIFQCHGDSDSIILYKRGQACATILKSLFPQAIFRRYRDVDHDITADEIGDIAGFIKKQVKSHL